MIGVSGTTVKRVDRLAREAPELLPRVAAGELSVKQALRDVAKRTAGSESERQALMLHFSTDRASRRLNNLIREEWRKWPPDQREEFLRTLQLQLRKLLSEYAGSSGSPQAPRLSEAVKSGVGVGLSH